MENCKTDDVYVHGMDWITKLEKFPLSNYRRYQYDLIGKYIGENVLEVGSGDRSFTELIIANNPELKMLFSIEPSETLFNAYKNRTFGATAVFGTEDLFVLDPNKHGLFDTIILVHVLEHIEHDKKALDHLHSLLSPNGKILIEVPALPILFSVHDEMLGHYRRYNRRNLKAIVDTDFYSIERLWYQDPFGILGSLLFFKLLKIRLNSAEGVKLVGKQGGVYDQILIPITKRLERLVTFPFGLSLTAVLRTKRHC
jgi:SAM-dependent methyltransferase